MGLFTFQFTTRSFTVSPVILYKLPASSAEPSTRTCAKCKGLRVDDHEEAVSKKIEMPSIRQLIMREAVLIKKLRACPSVDSYVSTDRKTFPKVVLSQHRLIAAWQNSRRSRSTGERRYSKGSSEGWMNATDATRRNEMALGLGLRDMQRWSPTKRNHAAAQR